MVLVGHGSRRVDSRSGYAPSSTVKNKVQAPQPTMKPRKTIPSPYSLLRTTSPGESSEGTTGRELIPWTCLFYPFSVSLMCPVVSLNNRKVPANRYFLPVVLCIRPILGLTEYVCRGHPSCRQPNYWRYIMTASQRIRQARDSRVRQTLLAPCPSCDEERPDANRDGTTFKPGTVCSYCGHVEPNSDDS